MFLFTKNTVFLHVFSLCFFYSLFLERQIIVFFNTNFLSEDVYRSSWEVFLNLEVWLYWFYFFQNRKMSSFNLRALMSTHFAASFRNLPCEVFRPKKRVLGGKSVFRLVFLVSSYNQAYRTSWSQPFHIGQVLRLPGFFRYWKCFCFMCTVIYQI